MRVLHLSGERLDAFLCRAKMQILLRVLGILVTAMPGLIFPSDPNTASVPELRRVELQVHQNVNRTRSAAGIRQLAWNENLAAEARRHAGNMARKNFFAHNDPARGDLSVRLDRSGINWSRCAENLYEEKGVSMPAEQAVEAWLRSRNHRRNMLDSKLEETGVGVALRKDGALVIVQEFLSD